MATRAATAGTIPDEYRHRLDMTWADGVCKGGINFLGIYLRDCEGFSEANLGILEVAGGALNGLTGPWIVAGDWNVNPETLAASGWLDMVGGVDRGRYRDWQYIYAYLSHFWEVSVTIVILTPGACGSGAPKSTSCLHLGTNGGNGRNGK